MNSLAVQYGCKQRGAGGNCPLEIWDYKVIIRKPKEREQNREKPWEKSVFSAAWQYLLTLNKENISSNSIPVFHKHFFLYDVVR